MKCVICGINDAHIRLNNFCPSCYVANNPLLPQTIPEMLLQLPFCNSCARIKIGRKWYFVEESSTLEPLSSELSRLLELRKDVELLVRQTTVEYSETGAPRTLHVQLTAKRQILPAEVVQQDQRDVTIKLLVQPCQQCTKFQSAHYEAVLQIRVDSRNLDPEESQWISQQLIEQTNKASEDNWNNYISKMEERSEGLDFYFGNASLALRLARELATSTAAQLQVSHKLISADPSLKHPKKRTTISFRLPSYRLGDFVSLRPKHLETPELVQILAFSRGTVQYHSYRNNSEISTPVKQFNERKPVVVAPALSVRPFMVIATLDDSVQLMDSQTYRTFEIRKNPLVTHMQPGETINAALIDEEVHVSFYHPEPVVT